MGYYTDYNLEISTIDENGNIERVLHDRKIEIVKDFRSSFEEAQLALDEDGYCSQSAKWYSSDEDIIAFSKKYPDLLFTLSGYGESWSDQWAMYTFNGNFQLVKAEVPPPDLSKIGAIDLGIDEMEW